MVSPHPLPRAEAGGWDSQDREEEAKEKQNWC